MQLESRYALSKSLLFFVGGLAAVALNTALYFFGPFYYPMVWFAGAIAILIGARALDRRVKLRIGSEGLWYAPWGAHPIPWGEFESFSVFTSGKFRLLKANPRYPEQLRTRLPALSRINSSINSRFGRPPFYINPTQLDVTVDRLLEALAHHKQHAA
jgi:hypothetical protein